MDVTLRDIPGVGVKSIEKLNRLNVFTVDDLMGYFPFRYEDRTAARPVSQLEDGDKALISIRFSSGVRNKKARNRKSITEVDCSDDTGVIRAIWFNQPYIANKIAEYKDACLYGKIQKFNGGLHIVNPEIENMDNSNKIMGIKPVYKLSKGILNYEVKKAALGFFNKYGCFIEDIIPEYLMMKYKLLKRRDALRCIHFPPDKKSYQRAKITLAFEELLILQLGLAAIKSGNEINKGKVHAYKNEINEFKKYLKFELTGAQNKVIEEIKTDMCSDRIMNRLVQGDVGSGKTVVSFFSVFLAWRNGCQCALMAPTEVLARQHYQGFSELFSKVGIRTEVLLGSQKKKEKEEIKRKLKNHEIDLIIGTHSLIQDDVVFKNLGLVVTDEQHRFGVKQRSSISEKGKNPDVLVMSATPIPRTLSLIVYGDLDVSVIDELPPGRKKIGTFIIRENKYYKLLSFVREELKKGRQIYFVAPAITENENDMISVDEIQEKLENEFLDCRISCIHGKLKNDMKEEVFKSFNEGNIDILVATTVVEVGVNVPNATVMVIEGADRFGLSQLHQLRGRVGRGSEKSYCFLVTNSKNSNTMERLRVIEKSNDGFFIAGEDLKLRGPGEFLGVRQHGAVELKFASSYDYSSMIGVIHEESKNIIEDSLMDGEEFKEIKNSIHKYYKNKKIILN
jgi:ATP-dependent DNA helicase RecG